jgi:glycerol-3-phosphate acyltransferase PlsY
MTGQSWAVLAAAFAVGSFPTAYLVTRLVAGADIRSLGDGNVGALNTFRSVGPVAGALVAAVDVGKGTAVILLARALGQPEGLVRAAGLCAVLGHDTMPLLGFRGGQGMAAILGIFGVLYSLEIAVGLVIAAAMLALTRNWDLSWAVAFGLFAGFLWLRGYPMGDVLYPVLLLLTIGLSKLVAGWRLSRLPSRPTRP